MSEEKLTLIELIKKAKEIQQKAVEKFGKALFSNKIVVAELPEQQGFIYNDTAVEIKYVKKPIGYEIEWTDLEKHLGNDKQTEKYPKNNIYDASTAYKEFRSTIEDYLSCTLPIILLVNIHERIDQLFDPLTIKY